VQNAALGNLNYATAVRDGGFQGYNGQQVANINPTQQQTINNASDIASGPSNLASNNLIGRYANAGPQSVQASTIADNMSPYMSQYVERALAPQLRQMDISNAATNQQTDALATSRGAFGDARQGVQQSNNSFNQAVQREGVIGNAYDRAFTQAIGAGSTDASNNLAAQNANAGYNETALSRALGGSNALQSTAANQMNLNKDANSLAQQDTANNQANLTARYNQWLLQQQYPFQTTGLVNSTTGVAANAVPASTASNTTNNQTASGVSNKSAVDNSGLSLLGSLGGALLSGGNLGGLFGNGSGGITYGGPNGPTAFI
jgi:hypothetical protein